MKARVIAPVLALTATALLAGCGGPSSAEEPSPRMTTPTASHTMADGTVMSGSSMASTSPAPTTTASAPPRVSPTAAMVCGPEIQDSIAILLKLPTRPTGTSTYRDGLFTCTYRLEAGPLVLSVQQSPSKEAAGGYFDGLRSGVDAAVPIKGLPSLGLPAFQSSSGIVAFVKDEFTLKVDASPLTPTLGPARTTRSELAYTLATDVLACWREH